MRRFKQRALEELPDLPLLEIGSHLRNQSGIRNLERTSKRMYSLFLPIHRVFDKFLQCVVYGEQDKAERLLRDVYQRNVENIQVALRWRSSVTDYSSRTFDCTAYEYAYWAKDTHMCRMLECYMDDATKALMLARIDEIERIDEATGKPVGLKYQQNGAEHRSAHFDLTPLIMALQEYVNGLDSWVATYNFDAREAGCTKVGLAQHDVPAHVAQEYCKPDRSFDPLPSFNVDKEDIPTETLPRVLVIYNAYYGCNTLWFPLGQLSATLDFTFAIIRGARKNDARSVESHRTWSTAVLRLGLAAINHLDAVRTEDLKLSRAHLKPSSATHGLSM